MDNTTTVPRDAAGWYRLSSLPAGHGHSIRSLHTAALRNREMARSQGWERTLMYYDGMADILAGLLHG